MPRRHLSHASRGDRNRPAQLGARVPLSLLGQSSTTNADFCDSLSGISTTSPAHALRSAIAQCILVFRKFSMSSSLFAHILYASTPPAALAMPAQAMLPSTLNASARRISAFCDTGSVAKTCATGLPLLSLMAPSLLPAKPGVSYSLAYG